jgi:hypothetical protein
MLYSYETILTQVFPIFVFILYPRKPRDLEKHTHDVRTANTERYKLFQVAYILGWFCVHLNRPQGTQIKHVSGCVYEDISEWD